MNLESINKTVKLKLVGIDGNAYFLMGAFQEQAEKEGWTEEEIDIVCSEAMSGDYNHLLRTLIKFCK